MALLLCGAAAGLGPIPTAAAAPVTDAGVGTVVADLGPDSQDGRPGFSHDGAYYSHLVPSGDRCDLHLYDVAARRDVGLVHAHVVCDGYLARWAAQTDTLQWEVDASAGEVTVYAWDAAGGQVSVLASDAHVAGVTGLSADGAYLSFTGRSDLHPPQPVDYPQSAPYVYDRAARTSLPLSKPDERVSDLSWSPTGHHFVAQAYGPESQASCVGTGTSCRVLSDPHVYGGGPWSEDGTAVIVNTFGPPASAPVVYDFSDGSMVPIPTTYGFPFYNLFVGRDARWVLAYLNVNPAASILWDRRTGKAVRIPASDWASPDGKYLLYRSAPYAYHYRTIATGADAFATYRGTQYAGLITGYWTKDGSSYLGLGPGGCSSVRQWSPETNTVSLFGPPAPRNCYYVPQPFEHDPLPSSASGRFGVVYQGLAGSNNPSVEYIADLRRHVLLGPVKGRGEDFAPAGSELLAIRQSTSGGANRLLLVDPTPVPDVDDKPRWSSATPSTGTAFTAQVGQQVHVVLQASDLQGTPVNPYFRWRTADGTPVASPPRGWTCERRRLAAGATVSDCTFAPPKDYTAVRFLDLSATNYVTGAQSDTRSYRFEATRAPKASGG